MGNSDNSSLHDLHTRIKKLEKENKDLKHALGHAEAALADWGDSELGDLRLKCREQEQEIHHLKEILFVCGEIAVIDWNDSIVGLVDKTLKGFTLPKTRYKEIRDTLKNSQQD